MYLHLIQLSLTSRAAKDLSRVARSHPTDDGRENEICGGDNRRRTYLSTAELEISCRALHTTCDKNWAAGSESLKTAFLRELTALGIYGTDHVSPAVLG